MSLLARYSAETSLKEYDERRRVYATQLKKYSYVFHNWKEEQKYASYIYEQHHQPLQEFRKRRDLAGVEAEQKEK